jgi:hypothetical protein
MIGIKQYRRHSYQCWSNVPHDLAFDPKYYGGHRNILIEVPKDRSHKAGKHPKVIFCIRTA